MPREKKQSISDAEKLAQIKMLSEKAQESIDQQLDLFSLGELGDEDIDFGFNPSQLKDTANPAESHRLYYGMMRLLKDNLPKGPENKKLRNFIYVEKSLFLNRGIAENENGIKGSDERMTYLTPFLAQAFNIIVDWVKTGANPYDAYVAFWDANEENGFHHKLAEETTESQKDFDRKLKVLLNTKPSKKD